jgi:hypothetical protein
MATKVELIFMKWKAELADMDRSKPAVEGNFELLFDNLYRAKIKMDKALPYLEKAIKAHYPSDFVVKNTYKRIKQYRSDSLSEFEKSWKEFISATAKRVFFAFYDIEGDVGPSKKVNGMSRAEYVKLQKYADSHETVDWESLIEEKEVAEAETVDEPQVDVSNINTDIDLGDL